MNKFVRIICWAVVCLPFVFNQVEGRKLPYKAYISSAKIAVIESRPEEAVILLDSLFKYHGHMPEALDLMSQIMVDFVDSKNTALEKAPFVEKMVAYFDSLAMSCDNKDIKKKYRKKCDKLLVKADSTKVKYWREFYNRGIEQLNSMEEMSREKRDTEDTSMQAYFEKNIAAKSDSCMANMKLSITIDSSDHRPYVAIGSVLEKKENYEEAIKWLEKALAQTNDSSSLLLSIAYDYINLNRYCDAIPAFSNYARSSPTDLSNAYNLSICYVRCEQFDEAVAVYRKMLEVDAGNIDALLGLGNFYRREAGIASKTASDLSGENEAESKKHREKANQLFDSSGTYYRQLIEHNPDSISGYEEYAVISYIRGRFEEAVSAFQKLTEFEPNKVDHWISLGDSHFYLKDFENTIVAYERAVELDPDQKEIWERLSDMYFETGKPDKKKRADKEIKRLEN